MSRSEGVIFVVTSACLTHDNMTPLPYHIEGDVFVKTWVKVGGSNSACMN